MRHFLSGLLLFGVLCQLGTSQLQYQWDYIKFGDLPRAENYEIDGHPYYEKENVFMTGFAYDSRSKFMCAGFPALKSRSPVTIGCFDTQKYLSGSSPVFQPFPSYRDNDLPGWPTLRQQNIARAEAVNNTEIVSDEDTPLRELRLDTETARVLSKVAGSNDQKVIVVYTDDDSRERPYKRRRPYRPRPPYHEEEEEEAAEEEVEEYYPPPPPPKRRPEYYSDEYRPHKKKRPNQQVIVIKDDNKNAVLELLNKFGNKLNPFSHFGNKKDDVVVYVKPNRRDSSEEYDHRPYRPRPKPTTTTTTTTTTEAPPVSPPAEVPENGVVLDQVWYRPYEEKPVVEKRPVVAGIRRPTYTIKRPLIRDNQVYEEGTVVESVRSYSGSLPISTFVKLRSRPSSGEDNTGDEKEEISGPHHFISVHRPYFDSCGRLWFIDTGSLEYSPKRVFYKNPTLWSFQVKRNSDGELDSTPYLKYEIKDSTYSGLRSLVVDIHGDCDHYHVYMPNQVDNTIVVYSSLKNRHWFFEHALLKPVTSEDAPLLRDGLGVSALALGDREEDGFRNVFVTIASSLAQYKVSSRLLRDSTASPDDFPFLSFKVLGYKPANEYSTATAYDYKSDVLFLTTFPETMFTCWNSRKFLNPDSVGGLFTNPKSLNGRDVQVDREGNIMFLTNNYESFTPATSLTSGINFEIYKYDTKDLIKGTICDPAKRDYRSLDVKIPSEVAVEEKPVAVEVLPEVKVDALIKEESPVVPTEEDKPAVVDVVPEVKVGALMKEEAAFVKEEVVADKPAVVEILPEVKVVALTKEADTFVKEEELAEKPAVVDIQPEVKVGALTKEADAFIPVEMEVVALASDKPATVDVQPEVKVAALAKDDDTLIKVEVKEE